MTPPITEYTLPGPEVFPEGITAHPDGRSFLVSSAGDGTVYLGDVDTPRLDVWLPAGSHGRTQALGMAVDAHGRLLVCGGSDGSLSAFDLATGAPLARHHVPASDTLLNDVCVAAGAAYVTDSHRPVLWRLGLDEKVGEPSEWLDLTEFGAEPEVLHYLNGIVAVEDESVLLVVGQGSEEFWRVDIANRTAERVDMGGNRCAGDGLLVHGGMVFACDNTEEPDGSVRYWLSAWRLSRRARRADRVGRWERPGADSPTTLAVVAGRLLLVNSQFGPRRLGTAAAPFTVSAVEPPLG